MEALRILNLPKWRVFGLDEEVSVKSAKAVDGYTPIKYFQENRDKLDKIANEFENRIKYEARLMDFLRDNELKERPAYNKL